MKRKLSDYLSKQIYISVLIIYIFQVGPVKCQSYFPVVPTPPPPVFQQSNITNSEYRWLRSNVPVQSCKARNIKYTKLMQAKHGTYIAPHSTIFVNNLRCGSLDDSATNSQLLSDKHMELIPIHYLDNQTIAENHNTLAAFFKVTTRGAVISLINHIQRTLQTNGNRSEFYIGFERFWSRECGQGDDKVTIFNKNTFILFGLSGNRPIGLTSLTPKLRAGNYSVPIYTPFHVSFSPADNGEKEEQDVCAYLLDDVTPPLPTKRFKACFPSFSTVIVKNENSITMRSLQIGQSVLVGKNEFSEIYLFSHRDISTQQHFFINLRTTNSHQLSLSHGHYIKTSNGMKPAYSIKRGELLLQADGTEVKVVNITTSFETGLYNPHTLKGEIVVNGIVLSCYTDALPIFTAHSLLTVFRAVYNLRLGFLQSFLRAESVIQVLAKDSCIAYMMHGFHTLLRINSK